MGHAMTETLKEDLTCAGLTAIGAALGFAAAFYALFF